MSKLVQGLGTPAACAPNAVLCADFHVEVHNSQQLVRQLRPGGAVAVPRVHASLSTSKVLTMEWITGHKVNDTLALRRSRISARAVGLELERAFAEMTFVHGYVHADPHPGALWGCTVGWPAAARGLAAHTCVQHSLVHGCWPQPVAGFRCFCGVLQSRMPGSQPARQPASPASVNGGGLQGLQFVQLRQCP